MSSAEFKQTQIETVRRFYRYDQTQRREESMIIVCLCKGLLRSFLRIPENRFHFWGVSNDFKFLG